VRPSLPCTRNLKDLLPGKTRSGRQAPLRERSATFPVRPSIQEMREMEEVHLWRGTPEQRSLRSSSRKFGQFHYFDQQLGHPDWTARVVLDFGGNQGNLLVDSNNRIRPQDYYCVDVIKEAIDEGRRQFPEAHWVHYDRYNCSFNPEGTVDILIPELGIEFDFILAYSVFTHIARKEMHDLVGQLRARLKPWGTLAFTFIDPHHSSCRQPTPAPTCDRDWNRPVEPIPPPMSPAFSRRVAARPGAP